MKSFLTGAFLLITFTLLGFLFGGLVATRIMTTGAMGFDQLADALGGFMAGSLAGLIAGIVLLRFLSPPKRWVAGLVAIAVICGCILYLRATPPKVHMTESMPLLAHLNSWKR